MKQKIGRIVKIICFCLVAVLMVNALEGLFKPKWLENRWASSKTNKSFYELEKNSTEVLFFGASVIAATADPYQLYEDYGISSYNLGVMSQPMIGTFFWFKEALDTQDIKVAVVEIKSAGKSSEKAEEKARKSYDYMRIGKNKLQYAIEYNSVQRDEDEVKPDLFSYLFPLSLYHSRWSELNYDDYDFFLGNNKSYTRGFSVLSTQFKDMNTYIEEDAQKGLYDGFEVESDKIESPNEVNAKYVRRIIELAKERNVKLLFVKSPDTGWKEKQHNYIQKIADENDIPFIDMNLKSVRKELDFNYKTDLADAIHLNIKGAKKTSEFLGKYLTENYDLTDYREGNNSVKKSFEKYKKYYEASIKEGELSFPTTLDEYLKKVQDKSNGNYEVILAAGSNVNNIKFTDEQKNTLINMGVSKKIFEDSEFGTNIVSVTNDGKTYNEVAKQSEDSAVSVSLGGTFSDGTDYLVKADATGSTLKLNDNECTSLTSYGFNIIVYDKQLKRVVSTVYLYSNNGETTLNRGE